MVKVSGDEFSIKNRQVVSFSLQHADPEAWKRIDENVDFTGWHFPAVRSEWAVLAMTNFTEISNRVVGVHREAIKELLYLGENEIWQVLKSGSDITDGKEASRACFGRTVAGLRSLKRLDHESDFQAIAMISRLIFELGIDVALLCGAPTEDGEAPPDLQKLGHDLETRAKRFVKYGQCKQAEYLQKLIDFHNKYPSKLSQLVLESLKQEYKGAKKQCDANFYDRNKGKKSKCLPNHWSGWDLRFRAHLVGLKYEELYLALDFCNYIAHSNPAAIVNKDKADFNWQVAICLKAVIKLTKLELEQLNSVFYLDQSIPNWRQHVQDIEVLADTAELSELRDRQ